MWAVYALVASLIYFVGNTLYTAGAFKSIQAHIEGTQRIVYTNMPGPEDMDLDDENALLFISSCDRRKNLKGQETEDGIYLLPLDSVGIPRKLATTFRGKFHPHGISYLKSDSIACLFVVNHNTAGNFVEIFEFRKDTLFHKKSISDDAMCCPNDVVAVDKDKFYVTNDHGTTKGFMRTLEEYLRIPLSSLLYYDGTAFSKAYGGLNYGNGVNISNDGKQLYLTTTTGQHLLTFSRNTKTGKLQLTDKLKLKTGVDNIDVDAQGNLWIGAHPKLLAFVAHAKDAQQLSPSQVLKLIPDPTGSFSIQEIYLDDGKQLSGSSVAVNYENELFIGVVFESKLVRVLLNK